MLVTAPETFGNPSEETLTTEQVTQPWRDPALPVADRVEALLAEMTLEEKVAQLGSRWVGNDMGDSGQDAGYDP